MSIPIPKIKTFYHFYYFVGYATEVITDCEKQQDIMKGIYVGLGDNIKANQ